MTPAPGQALSNKAVGAFVPGPLCSLPPLQSGLLDGLTFAVKDLIDVVGSVTGGGNPDWAADQTPADRNAPAVEMLLLAGAALRGKTITDELAFSLEGENWHYGTPVNPRWPDRLPGGSSSGSAVAVAGGQVDFALGTDTGGSVRVPAAFCGLFGFRPTHGRIPLNGVLPFSPSYDTVGWFARSGDVLARVGQILLGETPGRTPQSKPSSVCLAADAFAMTDPGSAQQLLRAASLFGKLDSVQAFDAEPSSWLQCYQILQGAEIWQSLGPWVSRRKPQFGPSISMRFAHAASITSAQVEQQQTVRSRIAAHMHRLLAHGVVLVMPTIPVTALSRNASEEQRAAFYQTALALNSIAGHAGLPQLSIPVAGLNDNPVGLSFIGARGSDLSLLVLAQEWSERQNR
jgi:amidase